VIARSCGFEPLRRQLCFYLWEKRILAIRRKRF